MNISAGVGRICNCIGPQNGQPLCPCRMASVTVENGRYVLRRDLGPIKPTIGRIEPAQQGCICPPGAEKTCQGPMCPRRPMVGRATGTAL